MATITVGSTSALNSALSSAQGGDTILLQAGVYSGISMQNKDFGSGVTITSADPAHQAVLTNFNIWTVQGLTFQHVDFKVLVPNFVGFNVYSSQNITFDQVHLYGPPGDPDTVVEGLRFFDSSHLTFSNSEVEQLARGVQFSTSDHIVVSGNHIHHMNSDALDFGPVSNVLITGNVLHDFYARDGAHPDGMQFYGNSSDITITGNLIHRGDGQNTQGIFIADGAYNRVTITDNTIVGTGSSAIRPIGVTDLTVSGNHLVTLAGGDATNMLVQFSNNVTSTNNTASSISFSTTTTNISQSGDVANAPVVSDGGAAVIQQWLAAHSSVAAPPPPPVNVAPIVGGAGGTTAFVEGVNLASVPVAVATGLTLADSDDTTLASAKVQITGGLLTGQDSLGFSNSAGMGNIAGSYNASTGVLNLTSSGSTATVAQWQAALRSVTYVNSSETPGTGSRVVAFSVDDGLAQSTAVTQTVSVAARNDAPSGADLTVAIGHGAVKVLAASDFGFSDPDGGSLQAVKITSLLAGGQLTNNGAAVTAGQSISVADIAAGHFVFTSAANVTAAVHAGFTFQVQDNGGTANGGTNLDPIANSFTINVDAAPVSNPPVIPPVTSPGNPSVIPPSAPAAPASGGGGGGKVQVSPLEGSTIDGGTANDSIFGNLGADKLNGGPGADTISGADGADTLNGGTGDDNLNGGEGQGLLRGDDGNDSITGGGDFDDINGNVGADTASGGGGDDWVVGGKDNDNLSGDAGADIVYGNLGDDTVAGGDGNDVVRGGQNNDILFGGAGNDYVSGDRGDDTVSGGGGADTFHSFGDAGVDRVLDFHQSEGDRVMLDAGTDYTLAQVGADTVISMSGGAQMFLAGVQLSSLHAGWIVVG